MRLRTPRSVDRGYENAVWAHSKWTALYPLGVREPGQLTTTPMESLWGSMQIELPNGQG